MEFLELKQQHFALVSRWEHFAIAELTALADFKSNAKWITKRLEISNDEAEQALARLTRVGLVRKIGGRYTKSKAHYRMVDTPALTIRQFHEAHLQRAVNALENQNFEERDISGTTLAFNRRRMSEVKALIREFRERMNVLCSESEEQDSVYQLGVQFFRLDKELR